MRLRNLDQGSRKVRPSGAAQSGQVKVMSSAKASASKRARHSRSAMSDLRLMPTMGFLVAVVLVETPDPSS